MFKGRSPTFKGQALTFKGRSPTFKGQALTFKGRSPTFKGQALTFKGQALTFKGRSPTFKGRSLMFKGRSPTFKGQALTFKGRRQVSERRRFRQGCWMRPAGQAGAGHGRQLLPGKGGSFCRWGRPSCHRHMRVWELVLRAI
jgi:DNA/RNA endonuclease YhcR with UshA esterase domain